jgi:hypothetical protein
MAAKNQAKALAFTFIKSEDQEIRIEKVQLETGKEMVRLSSSIGKKQVLHPLILSEEELLDLLNQAIHSGVLPLNFIAKLRDKIEI